MTPSTLYFQRTQPTIFADIRFCITGQELRKIFKERIGELTTRINLCTTQLGALGNAHNMEIDEERERHESRLKYAQKQVKRYMFLYAHTPTKAVYYLTESDLNVCGMMPR